MNSIFVTAMVLLADIFSEIQRKQEVASYIFVVILFWSRMDDTMFSTVLQGIRQSESAERKLYVLSISKGNFTIEQVDSILIEFHSTPVKHEAFRIMGTRMREMTCQKARRLLKAFSPYDRLAVLEVMKRYLIDSQTKVGEEYISSMFPFESQKQMVLSILQTVRSDQKMIFPAGGHKMDYTMGTTYSMAPPNDIHKYGSLEKQMLNSSSQLQRRQGKTFYPSSYVDHKLGISNHDDFDYEGTDSYPGVGKHSRSRIITLREKDNCMPLGCNKIGNYPSSLPSRY